ncbi:MAG TPA: hypothetical protein ENN80_11435 [Candidatus Hydrogenedentes bacterium]|nr:hypothetical protein [Candidatus Hydrogenedentota bacterium]
MAIDVPTTRAFLAIVLLGMALCAAAADYPPLCVEISPEHPLFLFEKSCPDDLQPATYASNVTQAWADLPDTFKPFSTLQIDVTDVNIGSRHAKLSATLAALQEANVPTVVRLADSDPRRTYPLELAEELVHDFTCIKGLQVVGFEFRDYYPFGGHMSIATPPQVRWLIDAIDIAARYGRFITIELAELGWPRIMANAWCKPLYEKLRTCAPYAVPVNLHRGAHHIARTSALIGLCLEGGAHHWGVGARSWWYSDAHFVEPGILGLAEQPSKMPPSIYRAMLLNGAMAGATVYTFAPDTDLWFGRSQHHWIEAIQPTLVEILDGGLIARRDFVAKKIKVAYQLAAAATPEEFHLNLRDIDGVFDAGRLVRGAYGMEWPGVVPELILNTGRRYWIPLVSPHTPEEVLASFDVVVHPAEIVSAEAWAELLDRYYDPDGEGTAFISRIGRGVFVMNTRENTYEEQVARIPSLPAPVRRLQARRKEDGIDLEWPFREGDVSYKVYRRVLPEVRFSLLAKGLDERRYFDGETDPNASIAYAVTALTNEQEPYSCVLPYGDYRTFSVVESRIAEEALLGPMLAFAESHPIQEPMPAPAAQKAPWPNLEGLNETQRTLARAVAERIEALEVAIRNEDLNAVMELYSTDYEDPQAWRFQYVRRAFQWFFERYARCTMGRQVRRWNFSAFDSSGQIDVLLYCRVAGVALTDSTGRVADVAAHFPRTKDSEIWLTFTNREEPWRIVRTNPAMPNFRDILSFSAGPADGLDPGPDVGREPTTF